MDRQTLESILKKPYNQPLWRQVLTEVFGARNLALQPPPITNLPTNDLAAEAFELGSVTTSDERVIGLYQINLTATAKIERNRVALRNLLRKIYKYDVDGALVVFVQNDKWRLSFISEIRVLNEDGTTDTKETEPKRYTYMLGRGEKVKTPAARLFELAGKRFNLEDIRERFSVEVLNKEFYEKVARSFYQLVGDTEAKGKKTIPYQRILELPGVNTNNKDNDRFYKEFAVRLIGRIVFCWFLREKMPDAGGKPLMPPELLSLDAVLQTPNYYHQILEPVFFQTLNTPVDERRDDLPIECEQIPFLNGGLFEPQTPDDYYEANKITGISKYVNTLKVPNKWFEEFFATLEEYNFTIDENSTTDILYGIDPEMLGRIFENLLAAIDQDTGEMARKATGSFYTPREIVDYMATESLVLYLHNKTSVEKEKLHELFKVVTETKFDKDEKEKLLDALDRLKILDPACGSGAFPMGVLQKITLALGKLDENAEWWKARQLKQINNAIIRRQVKEKLDSTNAEYVRKIGIIQNTLYGVDIQPIAAEISKLRCFLTLIVDETINDKKTNRGVEPLPNLEFKFVTADALLKLPESPSQRGFFHSDDQLERLHEIRQEYLQAYGDEKKELKERFEKLQDEISDRQGTNFGKQDARAVALSDKWKPFSHKKTDWFDPEWMFGVKEFEIVIGNPPYGVSIKGEYRKVVESSLAKVPDYEIYYYFIERANLLLKKDGILSYIIPNSYLFNTFAENYRMKMLDRWKLSEILDCSSFPIFQSAVVRNTINIWEKGKTSKIGYRNTKGIFNFQQLLDKPKNEISKADLVKFSQNWGLAFYLGKENAEIINIIKSKSKNLDNFFPQISQGLIAYDKYQGQSKEIIESRAYHFTEKVNNRLKPWLWGADITRYTVKWNGKEYIDYSDGIANPREPKYFKGERILIREITNPSIFAAFTQEELYNDPSILIILGENNQSLKSLLGILNSKLATFFHFNHSPKATKGAFPKILVKDIKEFPLPAKYKSIGIEYFVSNILFLKSQMLEDVSDKLMPIYFEQIIDGMVYELYFGDLLREHGREIIKHLGELPEITEKMSDAQKMDKIRAVFKLLNNREHPVRINLFYLDSIPEIRLIEGKDANN